MSQYIYGQWRGLPAREIRETGAREVFRVNNERTYEGDWFGLGFGYRDEFKPWPDQIDSDQWSQLHHA